MIGYFIGERPYKEMTGRELPVLMEPDPGTQRPVIIRRFARDGGLKRTRPTDLRLNIARGPKIAKCGQVFNMAAKLLRVTLRMQPSTIPTDRWLQ